MGSLIQRRMQGFSVNGITLTDAVAEPGPSGRIITLWFTAESNPDYLTPQGDLEIAATTTLGGAPIVTCTSGTTEGPVTLLFAGKPVEITPAAPERDLMAGRDCLVSIRNGERAENVLDWLDYHARHHGVTGAVILNRAQPGTNPEFAQKLEDGIAAREK